MTTQQVADRYYELAKEARWAELQNELFDENVINQEPDHVAALGIPVVTKGKAAIAAKGAANREKMEALHSQFCSEPQVAGNYFSLVLKRDVTFKGQPRMQREEVCVFQVKDGKIVSEQFFF